MSVFVASHLKAIMKVLVESPKVKALEAGLNWAYRILSSRIVEWAPQVKTWLGEEPYILYLGFTAINEHPGTPI